MSDQDRIRGKAAAVIEILKNRHKNSGPIFPSSASIIKAITSQPYLGETDVHPEEISASDHDDSVYQAFINLMQNPQRFQTCAEDPTVIECPKVRLMRIGREAEDAGKPSELFRYLMELTDNGLTLRGATKRAMLTAQKYLNIVIEFRKFAETFDRNHTNFKDLKREFRINREQIKIYVSESTLERALRNHDLEWSAYAIDAPRKGLRNKARTKHIESNGSPQKLIVSEAG
jgi:hypothetical protein